MLEDIADFVDGSGLVECPDCGEVVETEICYLQIVMMDFSLLPTHS